MSGTTHSESNRWLVLFIIMLGTFMAILDSSIVNVALPYMMSAFEVNRNQIEWITTGYMIASSVSMPLVGWLMGRLGYKLLYLCTLGVFLFGSMLCAVAWSYDSLVVARIIQAIGGGSIMPVGMAIVVHLFEPHERGKAMGVWGTGMMIGPTLGPTLGGYLTDAFGWRSIFSVNMPIGIATLLAAIFLMKGQRHVDGKGVPFDFWGFSFLSLAVVPGLLALSKGQEKGWDSTYIVTSLGISLVGAIMFMAVESTIRHPIFDLKLLLIRNYWVCMVLGVFRAIGLFGGIFLLPMFLESYAGYSTIRTGLWLMPGAITLGIVLPITGKMSDRYSPVWMVAAGALITGFSMILYGNLDPLSGAGMIIIPQMIRGVGLALMMSPLMTAAINSVPRAQTAMASSFLNVSMQIGGAFGIALLNTIITNSIHIHAVRIGELIGAQSLEYQRLGAAAADAALRHPYAPAVLGGGASTLTEPLQFLLKRASVAGFENGFVIGGLIVLASLPFCFLLKPSAHHRSGDKTVPEGATAGE